LLTATAVAVLVAGLLVPQRVHAEDQVQADARVQSGKIAYEKYCTSCHGAAGAPGSAVCAKTKKPIDLRTYVERNGGKFPTSKWFNAVFIPEPGAVHTPVWETIRKEQVVSALQTAGERDDMARGVVAHVADYIISIQRK